MVHSTFNSPPLSSSKPSSTVELLVMVSERLPIPSLARVPHVRLIHPLLFSIQISSSLKPFSPPCKPPPRLQTPHRPISSPPSPPPSRPRPKLPGPRHRPPRSTPNRCSRPLLPTHSTTSPHINTSQINSIKPTSSPPCSVEGPVYLAPRPHSRSVWATAWGRPPSGSPSSRTNKDCSRATRRSLRICIRTSLRKQGTGRVLGRRLGRLLSSLVRGRGEVVAGVAVGEEGGCSDLASLCLCFRSAVSFMRVRCSTQPHLTSQSLPDLTSPHLTPLLPIPTKLPPTLPTLPYFPHEVHESDPISRPGRTEPVPPAVRERTAEP